MTQQAAGNTLHVVEGVDAPLLYDTNRVRTYSCGAAEAHVLGCGERSQAEQASSEAYFDDTDLAPARERISRLSRLSESLAETSSIKDLSSGNPTYLFLHVCDACNLRCSYCYAEGCKEGDEPRRMSAQTARASIDFLLDHCRPDDPCVITFAGGEPLLNFDVIASAAAYARHRQRERSAGLELRILTNGTVMSPKILGLISEQEIFVQISLDGPPEVHDRVRLTKRGGGSSAKVLDTIQFLMNNGFRRFRVRATLSRHNSDIGKIDSFYRSQGIEDFSVQPVMCGTGEPFRLEADDLRAVASYYAELAASIPNSATKEASRGLPGDMLILLGKLLAGIKTKRHCGAGRSMLVVTPQGHFYPCPALVDDPRFRIGTLEQGMRTSLDGGFPNLSVDDKRTCRLCWARNLCGGGCAAQAIRVNGDVEEPDPQECALNKARIEAVLAIHHRLSY